MSRAVLNFVQGELAAAPANIGHPVCARLPLVTTGTLDNTRPRRLRSAAFLLAVLPLGAALSACSDDDGADAETGVQLSLPAPVRGITVVDGSGPLAWARDAATGDAVGYSLCLSEGCTDIDLVGLGGDAGDVVAAGSNLWIAPSSSQETMRVVSADGSGAVTPVGSPLESSAAVGANGDFVYAADAFELYRFEATNPSASPEVAAWTEEAATPGAVVASADAVWVFGLTGDVVRVDAATLKVTASSTVGLGVNRAGAVAVGPDGLYVVTTVDGADTLVALDPDTLEVVATHNLDTDSDITSAAVAVVDGRVVVATDTALIEFDPATLSKGDVTTLPFGLPVGIAAVGETMWVATVAGVTIVAR